MKSILTDHPARQVTGLRLGSCTRWGTEEPSDPCTPLQTPQGLLVPDSVPTSSHTPPMLIIPSTMSPHAGLLPTDVSPQSTLYPSPQPSSHWALESSLCS